MPRRVRLEEIVAPVASRRAVAGLEHDGGTAFTVALQVEMTTTADVDQTRRSRRSPRRATRPLAWRLGRRRAAPGRRQRGLTRARTVAKTNATTTGRRCMWSLRAPSVAAGHQRRAAARRGARRVVPQHNPAARGCPVIPVGQGRAEGIRPAIVPTGVNHFMTRFGAPLGHLPLYGLRGIHVIATHGPAGAATR